MLHSAGQLPMNREDSVRELWYWKIIGFDKLPWRSRALPTFAVAHLQHNGIETFKVSEALRRK
jgi:hypothetical protein